MSKLGKYFSLEKLTVTHENLDNTPGLIQIQKLKELVKNILDPLGEMIGEPIAVNSGYRTLAVNKAVGGAQKPISQHTKVKLQTLNVLIIQSFFKPFVTTFSLTS